MPISPLPGTFNQKTWPGVGDVDDCQVLSAFWTMVAARQTKRADLPTISKFRYEAGNPDDPGRSDGLTNTESIRAIRKIWPTSQPLTFIADIEQFKVPVRENGYVASVSVKSSLLPASLRFGFSGLHQVAVAHDGKMLRLMNPLAPAGSEPLEVTWAELRVAAYGVFDDGKVHAIVVPTKPLPVDPTVALKAEITSLKAQVAAKDATIATLTAKIAAVRKAIL